MTRRRLSSYDRAQQILNHAARHAIRNTDLRAEVIDSMYAIARGPHMSEAIRAGDYVAYSATFCRSIGAFTGAIPFARGYVCEVIGKVARIDWDNPDVPERVNVANLVRVDPQRGLPMD